jgi:hypothetical protein
LKELDFGFSMETRRPDFILKRLPWQAFRVRRVQDVRKTKKEPADGRNKECTAAEEFGCQMAQCVVDHGMCMSWTLLLNEWR